ncbi:MAG: alanine racemase [Cyanobacteria bacterium P01_H01_bin.74]
MTTNPRQPTLQARRDAWVEIDLAAIEHNAKTIRGIVNNAVGLMAIVKADAYGHGAAMIAPVLEASGIAMLGVASIDEAIHLREAGIQMPILVIGIVPHWSVQYAIQYDIQLTVFSADHLQSLEKMAVHQKKPVSIHVKVDTGMHRIGVAWEEAAAFIGACQQNNAVVVAGMFTHLKDSKNPQTNQAQLARWQAVCDELAVLPKYVHHSNSGYIINTLHTQNQSGPVPESLARVGLALYGYPHDIPIHSAAPNGTDHNRRGYTLKPALSLKARIIRLETVPENTSVGYGDTYVTPTGSPTVIATVPIGYADGLFRGLSGKIEGFLNGKRIAQIGLITMDQLMFDVTDVPECRTGQTITLIGEHLMQPDALVHNTVYQNKKEALWLDTWANLLETVEYELMCSLRVRLPKIYTRH